jgi:hypothetical protein
VCWARLPARRLSRVMRLVSQLHCLWSETGALPVRGTEGIRKWLPAELQIPRRVGSIPTVPAEGVCRRLQASFALTSPECDSRHLHGLVRKVAVLLGREGIRGRYSAGPPRACAWGSGVPLQGAPAGSTPATSTTLVSSSEAPPLVSASRRERYPRPARSASLSKGHRPPVRDQARSVTGGRLDCG